VRKKGEGGGREGDREGEGCSVVYRGIVVREKG